MNKNWIPPKYKEEMILPKREATIIQEAVDYHTAVKLAEAGFPKPTPDVGQVWHYDYRKVQIHKIDEFGRLTHNYIGEGKVKENFENAVSAPYKAAICAPNEVAISAPNEVAIFAPNEDDIKEKMPDWELVQTDIGWTFYLLSDPKIEHSDYKPYVACAKAWLAENENMGKQLNS